MRLHLAASRAAGAEPNPRVRSRIRRVARGVKRQPLRAAVIGGLVVAPLPGTVFLAEAVRRKWKRKRTADAAFRHNPPIDFKQIDLRERFDRFNRDYFGNRLPQDVVLKFRQLRGATGQCRLRVAVDRGALAMSRALGTQIAGVRVLAATITMSTTLIYEDAEFDRFFLHEMIHLALAVDGYPAEQHGPRFMQMAKEIGEKAGLQIPKVHQLVGNEALNVKPRNVGVIAIPRDGERPALFALWQPTTANLFKYSIIAKDAAPRLGRPVRIYLMKTKAYAMTTVKRAPQGMRVVFYPISEQVGRELDLGSHTPTVEFLPDGTSVAGNEIGRALAAKEA